MAHIEQNKALIPRAKKMRKDMTPQERRLWYDFLRKCPIHIYRQRVIWNYIVDFYCPKAKLVIEIDGSQHYTTEGLEYDEIRTEILEQYQLEVIRFSNLDIEENFTAVCRQIEAAIGHRTSP